MPLELSVTLPRDPSVAERAIVAPPTVTLFPDASCACTVIVDVENPSLKITVGLTVICVVVADAAPGVTLKLLLSPVSEPAELVAVMVHEPTLLILTVRDDKTPDVNAEEVPCPASSVQEEEISTVPEKSVTTASVPSTAEILMLKLCPASLLEIFPEGTLSILNSVSCPSTTTSNSLLSSEASPAEVAVRVYEPVSSMRRFVKSAIPSEFVLIVVVDPPVKTPEPLTTFNAISISTPPSSTELPN